MADYVVTPAGAGAKDGSSWAAAMGLAEFETSVEGGGGQAVAVGDNYYLNGSFTLTSDFLVTFDGTQAAPVSVIGVMTQSDPPVAADWADADNRQAITAGSILLDFDNYWHFHGLDITGTGSSGSHIIRADQGALFCNCKVENTAAAVTEASLYLGGQGGRAINCEVISQTGRGVYAVGRGCTVLGCYIHDCGRGIYQGSDHQAFMFNLIEGCSVAGIDSNSRVRTRMVNNTIYNNAIGIWGTTAGESVIWNNILDSNTVGAQWTTEQLSNWLDWNLWNNTGDVTQATKGPNAVNSDPLFANAAGGDFSLLSGSPARGVGFPGAFAGGLATGYLDLGAVQRRELFRVHPGMQGGMRG